MKISGIYLIFCKVNKKKYLGSSIHIKNRFSEHKTRLHKNYHANQYLQNAWNKYGEDSFKFSIIEKCSEDQLIEREQYWIDKLNVCNHEKGYNLRPLAASNLGVKFTKETKRKISASNMGKKRSLETIQKQKLALTGRKLSKEHKKKISESGKGRKHSEETKQKISKSHKGKKISKETKQKMSIAKKNMSQETRKKIGEASKALMTDEKKQKLRDSHLGKKQSKQTIAKRMSTIKRNKENLKNAKHINNFSI